MIWLVIAPAVVLLTWFLYRISGDAPPAIRRLLTAIRILAFAFVIALLFNPSRETQIVERQKTLAIVMVDTSASMDHHDGYETSPEMAAAVKTAAGIADRPIDSYSRLDLVKAVLDRTDRKFLETLSKNHDVRVYAFAEGLQSVPGIGELEARGRTTALGTALERVLEEPDVKSRPTGGILRHIRRQEHVGAAAGERRADGRAPQDPDPRRRSRRSPGAARRRARRACAPTASFFSKTTSSWT